MGKTKILSFWLLSCIFSDIACATTAVSQQANQLIVVLTPTWEATQGQLQRYERTPQHTWKKFGDAITVVVGKRGMGWGVEFSQYHFVGPHKQEGDQRTPVGLYKVGPLFGFEPLPDKSDYFLLSDSSVCVDDQKSKFYNQLLDSKMVNSHDWQSSEQMRQISVYRIGGVVQYNAYPSQPGAGSCIFLHIWDSPTIGTGGCVAMDEDALQQLIEWIEPSSNPVIGLFTQEAYDEISRLVPLPGKI